MSATPSTSLRGLRTFCIAARYENFTTASEELFITPSAVSHQVKALEQELDEKLFIRKNRDLELTEAGRSLYEEVCPLIDQLNAIVARHKKGTVRKTIRISVQPFFASEYFVPRLNEFTAANPDIDIRVGTSDESAEKHPADADLSIRLFKSPPSGMTADLLFPLRMAPAGSKEFLKTVKTKNGEIISEFPMIVHESLPKAWKQWSKATGIKLPEASKVMRLDSMIAVVRAAERGLGAALIPVPIGNLWFEKGSVVALFDKELVADVSYYLVRKQEQAGDASVSRLTDWIIKSFQNH
ncbi:MAG: LysR substrate-binding domain-containing protein [Woeseiaceae bacterium]